VRDLPIDSLHRGTWFKLICGASYGHLPAIYNLTIAYALAGADCIDVAADPAAIAAVRSGLEASRQFSAEARERGYPTSDRPLIMASLNDGEDPHFRKATFDPAACPPECDRPCERICPADAIPPQGSIVEDKCYGCGRCLPICPHGLIDTIDRRVEPKQILSHIISGDIDAIEIHTQLSHQQEFIHLWQQLAPAASRLQLLSISCPDGDGAIEYLHSIAKIIGRSESAPAHLMWQTDGRPMSGDIGAGTTHAAIRFGAKVAAAKLPGFVQLAGGTNSYTASKLRELNLLPSTGKPDYISGIAYGSYARVLLSPILERLETRAENSSKLAAHPDLLWAAVDRAYQLVGQLKQSQESQVRSQQ
jgi:Fe-S-cluster-containing hydrogenase component 2